MYNISIKSRETRYFTGGIKMPNWTTNKIIMNGSTEDIKKLRKTFGKKFSFNDVIHMPKCLNDFGGVPSGLAVCVGQYYKNSREAPSIRVMKYLTRNHIYLGKLTKERMDASDVMYAEKAIKNIEKTGYAEWYTWSCEHWGTKWDACDSVLMDEAEDELVYAFSTAWCAPFKVFEELSKQYPNVEFECRWQDEDDDTELGEDGEHLYHYYVYSNGNVIDNGETEF